MQFIYFIFQSRNEKERLDIERKIEKLENAVGGIVQMEKLPEAMVLVDINREKAAVYEAKATGVTTVALVDSNADPNEVDYPVPMNDDATGAVEYVLQVLADAMSSAKSAKSAKKKVVKKKVVKEKKSE